MDLIFHLEEALNIKSYILYVCFFDLFVFTITGSNLRLLKDL